MDPKKRTLARITVPDAEASIEDLVERLMGTGPKISDESFEFGGLHAEEPVDDADDTEGAPATGY